VSRTGFTEVVEIELKEHGKPQYVDITVHNADGTTDVLTFHGDDAGVKIRLTNTAGKLSKLKVEYDGIETAIDDIRDFISNNSDDFNTDFSQDGYHKAALKVLDAMSDVVGML